MSKLLQNPNYTEKQQINQNINAFVGLHDLTCNCDNPLKCIVLQIYNREKTLKFNTQEIQQWLTTTEDHGAVTTGEKEEIDGEDLEALFAEEDTTNTG